MQKTKKDTGFIRLIIDDGGLKTEKLSFINELQVQPVTRKLYHADFYDVDISSSQVFDVELILVGNAVGVENGGMLQHAKRHLKISCLPKDLPGNIEVDVTSLDLGQAIKVQDIELSAGLTAIDPPDDAVASIIAIKAAVTQEVEEEAAEDVQAAETAKEEKKEKEE